MIGAGLNDPGFVFFVLVLILPIFLLIAYVTILMMDRHAENDDE